MDVTDRPVVIDPAVTDRLVEVEHEEYRRARRVAARCGCSTNQVRRVLRAWNEVCADDLAAGRPVALPRIAVLEVGWYRSHGLTLRAKMSQTLRAQVRTQTQQIAEIEESPDQDEETEQASSAE